MSTCRIVTKRHSYKDVKPEDRPQPVALLSATGWWCPGGSWAEPPSFCGLVALHFVPRRRPPGRAASGHRRERARVSLKCATGGAHPAPLIPRFKSDTWAPRGYPCGQLEHTAGATLHARCGHTLRGISSHVPCGLLVKKVKGVGVHRPHSGVLTVQGFTGQRAPSPEWCPWRQVPTDTTRTPSGTRRASIQYPVN